MAKAYNFNSSAYGFYKEEIKGVINSFCSMGCKNYALTSENGSNIVKVRGFNLSPSAATRDFMSPDSMKNMIQDFLKGNKRQKSCAQFNMKLDRINATVKSREFQKLYCNWTFDKRFVLKYDDDDDEEENILNKKTAQTIAFGCRHRNFSDVQP